MSTKASRFAVARDFAARHRIGLIAGASALGIVLLSAAAYAVSGIARTESPIPEPSPPPAPLAQSVGEEAPSVQQGVRLVAATMSPALRRETRSFGPASERAQAEPRDVHGTAKRGGVEFVTSAAAYANVKYRARKPIPVAKRIAPPPPALPTPDWLWTTVRTSESDSLRTVPELRFHSVRTKTELAREFRRVVNQHTSGSDAFLDAVVRDRPDLAGLPFLKGNDCRLTQAEAGALGESSRLIREMLDFDDRRSDANPAVPSVEDKVVANLLRRLFFEARGEAPFDLEGGRNPAARSMPALMQILAVQPANYRVGLVRRLKLPSGDDDIIASFVRLALFDPEPQVRSIAVKALEYEPIDKIGQKLIAGFRHPSPHVAEHAADAIVALKRVDLLPKIVDFLDDPDPAAPFEREQDGTKAIAVHELVKINHHRNCMLCHAPAKEADSQSLPGLVARVPSPDETMPPMNSQIYYQSDPRAVVVRANETYLRQDFSRLEKVDNPGKWPAMQRFDYLVRTRTLTPEEALRRQPTAADTTPSPHHRAALSVLSRLTSTYLGTKSSDWRDEIDRRIIEAKDAVR